MLRPIYGRWFLYSSSSPEVVRDNRPARPTLGQSVFTAQSVIGGDIVLYYHDNPTGELKAWMLLPHPEYVEL